MLMIPRGLSSVIPLVSSEAHSRSTRMVLPRQLRGITFTHLTLNIELINLLSTILLQVYEFTHIYTDMIKNSGSCTTIM